MRWPAGKGRRRRRRRRDASACGLGGSGSATKRPPPAPSYSPPPLCACTPPRAQPAPRHTTAAAGARRRRPTLQNRRRPLPATHSREAPPPVMHSQPPVWAAALRWPPIPAAVPNAWRGGVDSAHDGGGSDALRHPRWPPPPTGGPAGVVWVANETLGVSRFCKTPAVVDHCCQWRRLCAARFCEPRRKGEYWSRRAMAATRRSTARTPVRHEFK